MITRSCGEDERRAVALGNLANAYRYPGHLYVALELSTEAMQLAEAAGSASAIAGASGMLSILALDSGETGRAASLARDSLAIRGEIGDPSSLAQTLEVTAAVMSVRHRAESAAHVCGAAFALRKVIESPISGCDRSEVERHLASFRSALGETTFARAWARGARLSPDATVYLALQAMDDLAAGER